MARRRLEAAIQAGKAIHQGMLSLCNIHMNMASNGGSYISFTVLMLRCKLLYFIGNYVLAMSYACIRGVWLA